MSSTESEGLAFKRWGSGDGLPLMLLHGMFGDSGDWAPMSTNWGDRPVLAVDLPGHGRSIGLRDDRYSLPGAASACLHVADQVGWSRFAVLGYSMGGRIACHLALTFPDRVAALVAESAHPGLDSDLDRAARRTIDAERATRVATDLPGFLSSWYAQPLFETLTRVPGLVDTLVRRRAVANPVELARALVGLSTGTQEPLGERLRAMSVPALFVSGRLDPAYDRLLAHLADDSTGLRHVSIDGAGHAVHLERPDVFARVVVSFIEQYASHVDH